MRGLWVSMLFMTLFFVSMFLANNTDYELLFRLVGILCFVCSVVSVLSEKDY